MQSSGISRTTPFAALLAPLALAAITGCEDVQYKYNIPQAASDCPTDTEYRNGGTRILDRNGGTRILDRSGSEVGTYCEQTACPGGDPPIGDPIMEWHLKDHGIVIARRTCPADEPSPGQ